jgi:hypothetical protein
MEHVQTDRLVNHTKKLIEALRAEEAHRREDESEYSEDGHADLADIASLIANSLGRIADSLAGE